MEMRFAFQRCGPAAGGGRTLLSWLLLCSLIGQILADNQGIDLFSEAMLSRIETQYNLAARQRIEALRQLIQQELAERPLQEQLQGVNRFFNQTPYISDLAHWNKKDYWATPVEMLASNGADCEDYAIGKYFALRALGVPEEHLRLTYVKAVNLSEYHMVLTYANDPRAVPLVLDNLSPDIRPGTERKDLVPVYSFNASGLWLAKELGKGQLLGGSERISLWRELQERMK